MPAKKNAKAKAAAATMPSVETDPPPVSAVAEAKDVLTEMPASPTEEKKQRRGSASVTDVLKPEELAAALGEDKDLVIAKEVAKLNWKMNTSPGTLEEAKAMKDTPISNPKVRKLHVFFTTGLHVTVRASASAKNGVSVFDVLHAIHKMFKKKADDELELPVLADIEWGRGDDLKGASPDWPAVVLVKQKREQAPSGKKKAK